MPVLESPSRNLKGIQISSNSKPINDDDKVFVCEVTGKAFIEYGDFAYNFMNLRMEHWKCEYTKRSSLTYMQALESKQKVHKQAKNLPTVIRQVILHLIRNSKHCRHELLAHDVYYYVKDRFFKGEHVNVYLKASKTYSPATIISVSALPDSSFVHEPSPQVCSYRVLIQPKKQFNLDQPTELTLGYDSIKRSPRVYTEAINRCIVYTSTKLGTDGFLHLMENTIAELDNFNFEDVFTNLSVPQLKGLTVLRILKYANGSINGINSHRSQTILSPKKVNGVVENAKPGIIDKRDANERFKDFLKSWHKHKDDLLLEDHKMLPSLPVMKFDSIPSECVGDLLSILSFFDDFSGFQELKDLFGFTLDLNKLSNAISKPESVADFYEIVYKLSNFLLKYKKEPEEKQRVEKSDGIDESGVDDWLNHYTRLLKHQVEANIIPMSEILRLHLIKLCDLDCKGNDTVMSKEFYSAVKQITDKLNVIHVAHISACDKIMLLKAMLREVMSCEIVRQCAEKSREEARQFSYNIFRLRASKQKYGIAIDNFKKGKKKDPPVESIEELLAKYKECEEKLSEMSSNCPSFRCFGRDRAFRRYLLFKSIPALCVETNSTNIGDCIDHIVHPDPILAKCSYSEKIKELKKRCFVQKAKPLHQYGSNGEKREELLKCLNMCCASKDRCSIHKPMAEVWHYISTPEMFTDLLTSLNDRGTRESTLKNSLKQSKSYIEDCLSRCPLPQILSPPTSPNDKSDSESLEKDLRSSIHSFEKELSSSELGKVDVKDREIWLSKVVMKGDRDTENPPTCWGPELQFTESVNFIPDGPQQHMSSEQWESHKRVISNLRSIILRLGQGVDRQNLKNPLVVTTRSGNRRIKHYDNIDRWENSLMTQATSVAQVALHFKALQDSILWYKSVNRRSCFKCKKSNSTYRMVLCEKCNNSYHVYCLKPKRKLVPVGSWFCNSCREPLKSNTSQEPTIANSSKTPTAEETPSKIAKLTNGYKLNAEVRVKLQSSLEAFFKKPEEVLRHSSNSSTTEHNTKRLNGDADHHGRSRRTRKLC